MNRMTKSGLLLLIFSLISGVSQAQFHPAAGQPGTSAIAADSNVFVAWANAASIERGWMDVADKSQGLATFGQESDASGQADNMPVSLGDSGRIILTFSTPLVNGPGYDFAVFENSFDDYFLEMAFVEVSSDGINYFRFTASSHTDTTPQVGGFGQVDPTKVNNLAGKYRATFGTPFDLDELKTQSGLDVNAITHIRLIDVIGTIDPQYASRDGEGKIINEPYPTPFASGGFDLDAVGVIHDQIHTGLTPATLAQVRIYPNPTTDLIQIVGLENNIQNVQLLNLQGQLVANLANHKRIDLRAFATGMYILRIQSGQGQLIHQKIQKR